MPRPQRLSSCQRALRTPSVNAGARGAIRSTALGAGFLRLTEIGALHRQTPVIEAGTQKAGMGCISDDGRDKDLRNAYPRRVVPAACWHPV